jgi:hypothetical protein
MDSTKISQGTMGSQQSTVPLPASTSSDQEHEWINELNAMNEMLLEQAQPENQDALLAYVGHADLLGHHHPDPAGENADMEGTDVGQSSRPQLQTAIASYKTPYVAAKAQCHARDCKTKTAPHCCEEYKGSFTEWCIATWSSTLPARPISNGIFYPFSEPYSGDCTSRRTRIATHHSRSGTNCQSEFPSTSTTSAPACLAERSRGSSIRSSMGSLVGIGIWAQEDGRCREFAM